MVFEMRGIIVDEVSDRRYKIVAIFDSTLSPMAKSANVFRTERASITDVITIVDN